MSDRTVSNGVIRGIAYRPAEGEPMQLIEACTVVTGRGLELENRAPGRRCVTLLCLESWSDTCRELDVQLPWYTRRANLLVEGIDLGATIGHPIQIGPVRLWIHAETKPCKLMDELHSGLRAALVPSYRGGVLGQTLTNGTVRLGDSVVLEADKG